MNTYISSFIDDTNNVYTKTITYNLYVNNDKINKKG